MEKSFPEVVIEELREIKKKILKGMNFYEEKGKEKFCLGMIISESIFLLDFITDLYLKRPKITKKEAKISKKEFLEIKEILSKAKKGPRIKEILKKLEKVLCFLDKVN